MLGFLPDLLLAIVPAAINFFPASKNQVGHGGRNLEAQRPIKQHKIQIIKSPTFADLFTRASYSYLGPF